MKGPVCDCARHNGHRKAIKHKPPPRLTPTSRKYEEQTNHRKDEGRKKDGAARTLDMVTRMMIAQ
jgi:hypothetical protein